MMGHYYPQLHRVYADRYGTVWSNVSASSGLPDESAARVFHDAASKEQSGGPL